MTTGKSGRRIESEEQYQKSLDWMRKTAVQLDDPLLDDATREKLQKQYDFVEAGILRYKRGERVRQYPALRETYKRLGWEFDDPIESQPEPIDSQPEREPEQPSEPKRETEQQASAAYSWLDDD